MSSKAGALLLSGDTACRATPSVSRTTGIPARAGKQQRQKQSAASMQRMADLMTKEKARHWINHNKA